jgi:hypothetical protein
MLVGFRNLDVVAEDELNFTFSEPMPVRSRSRCSICAKILLAVAAQVAQFVEFLSTPAAITPPSLNVSGGSGTIVLLDASAQIAEFIHCDACRAVRRSAGQPPPSGSHLRDSRQRRRQRQHIPGICRLQRDPAQQTLQIEDPLERPPQLFAPTVSLTCLDASSRLDLARSTMGAASRRAASACPSASRCNPGSETASRPHPCPAKSGSISSRLRTVTASSTRQFCRS